MMQNHVEYCLNTWCDGNKVIINKILKVLVDKFISNDNRFDCNEGSYNTFFSFKIISKHIAQFMQ